MLSQFHYGSIKTVMKNIINGIIQESQFHYGSIKTNSNFSGSHAQVSQVSIPLWFD